MASPATSVSGPEGTSSFSARVLIIAALAIACGVVTAVVAQGLLHLIWLLTSISFHGHLSLAHSTPEGNHLGVGVLFVPVIGGLIVGVMARYGSPAIRGHGIPEAMEQVLFHQSRIPPRVVLLKPLSAALSIGTGGPFGAEGPIIATGGALGSLVGQLIAVSAHERKTLLAAGAAAGMAAIFGSPVSAVLLAVELLLFEYRPRSFIPVALAATAATSMRILLVGTAPIFPIPPLIQPGPMAMAFYILLGGAAGVVAVLVTRVLFKVEDAFEKLPIHWMWWPALGAVVVGAAGLIDPRCLGIGYTVIDGILAGTLAGRALLLVCVLKLVAWTISLGSGTSGGTLAPLFTIGGGFGGLVGLAVAAALPSLGVDPKLAALVGMASLFSGASRAPLASAVFAFEATREPVSLLPLLGGSTAAILASYLLMPNSIMTEKIARHGGHALSDYSVDFLDQVMVAQVATREVSTLLGTQTIDQVRTWLSLDEHGTAHQGYPILGPEGSIEGLITVRDLRSTRLPGASPIAALITRLPVVVYEESTLREAVDHMLHQDIGRVMVVKRIAPTRLTGILSRSDVLAAHRRRFEDAEVAEAQLLRRGHRIRPEVTNGLDHPDPGAGGGAGRNG